MSRLFKRLFGFEEDREEFARQDEFFGTNGFTFNIVLIGISGSGKSSFVNTIRG